MNTSPKNFWRLWWHGFRHRFKDVRGYYLVRHRAAGNSRLTAAMAAARAVWRPRKTVLFYPERPAKDAVAYQLCALLGYAITTNPRRRFEAAVKWLDATFSDAATLRTIPAANHLINAASLDISKSTVGKVFAEVFGYPLTINPAEFHGKIVEKSDQNAAHDGHVLDGPLAPENIRPGCVYQKMIDNAAVPEGLVLDYRLPVFGGTVPLVFLKYRPLETRFSDVNNFRAELAAPGAVFSPAELQKIVLLARKMGVDYGELDVLRDKDGRLYVVDVNHTPHGPPKVLAENETKRALEIMAAAFARLLELKFTGSPSTMSGGQTV